MNTSAPLSLPCLQRGGDLRRVNDIVSPYRPPYHPSADIGQENSARGHHLSPPRSMSFESLDPRSCGKALGGSRIPPVPLVSTPRGKGGENIGAPVVPRVVSVSTPRGKGGENIGAPVVPRVGLGDMTNK
jgi:hypothetical protein